MGELGPESEARAEPPRLAAVPKNVHLPGQHVGLRLRVQGRVRRRLLQRQRRRGVQDFGVGLCSGYRRHLGVEHRVSPGLAAWSSPLARTSCCSWYDETLSFCCSAKYRELPEVTRFCVRIFLNDINTSCREIFIKSHGVDWPGKRGADLRQIKYA